MFNRSASLKDTCREISRGLNRFFSIFAIVAIGVGFFVGVKATSPDMKLTADVYYSEANLMDMRLVSTLGFEEADVEAVLYSGCVQSVMPSYSADALMSVEGSNQVVRIHAIPRQYGSNALMNVPALVEGRLPSSSGECVIEENNLLNGFSFRLGDKIKLVPSAADDELSKRLKATSFTIVGFVRSPEYISMERGVTTIGSGSVHCYIMVPSEDFSYPAYTEIYVALAGARDVSGFSQEYKQILSNATAELKALGQERSVIRYNNVKRELTEKIRSGKAELSAKEANMEQVLSEALAKIEDARAQISNAEAELKAGEEKFRIEIKDAEQKLKDGHDKYNKGNAQYEKEYAAFQNTRRDAQAQIEAGERDLNQLQAQINQLQASMNSMSFLNPQRLVVYAQLNAMRVQYARGRTQLNNAKAQLANAEQELKNAKAELDRAKRDLEKSDQELNKAKLDAQKQIDEARLSIEKSKAELAQGEADYARGKAEAEQKISEAKAKLGDAENALLKLEVPEWLIFTRDDNPGYSSFKDNANRLDGVASLFPFFFLTVAGLVCLTTMMRMVEEQRGQIGIYKALGYGRFSIAVKYFAYAMLASLLGSLLGISVGHILIPNVIYGAFDMMYSLPDLITMMPWRIAVASAAIAVICTALAAFVACNTELAAEPATLMRPKPPRPGKRVFIEKLPSVWSRMSFISKVTARNLLRYKLRFFMTVLGIAGCMALMVAGFGLRDSVTSIVAKQFDEIETYDIVLRLNNKLSPQDVLEVRNGLENDARVLRSMLTYQMTCDDVTGGKKTNVKIFLPEAPENLAGFIQLRQRTGRSAIKLTNEGAIITEKLADMHGLNIGDSLTLKENGREVNVMIDGITENYVQHNVYMTPQVYKKAFGELPAFNSALVCTVSEDESAKEAFVADWLKQDNILMGYSISSFIDEFSDSIQSMNIVVLVMIFCAGALAFVVLYNLTNINISERIREIATIKVLGFFNNEVANFVFRENVILTLIGIAAGAVLGVILHRFVVVSAEVDIVMFGRGIKFLSFIYSALLTLLFTFVVNFIMGLRVRRISMVESLKTLD